MPVKNDVAFGFDPRPFNDGIKKAISGMEGLTKKVGHVATQIVGKLLIMGVAIKGAQMLWNKFREGAPEIQKAFSIAGDIIFKNFFWPIRQALLPILQKLLDWVRDHRTTFVKWGGLVVSVFKTAIMVVKTLYGALKSIIDAVAPRFKTVFSKGFMDTMNLFIVKVAFVALFISNIIKSIAGDVGGVITDILDIAAAIWDVVSGWFSANKEGKSFWTLIKAMAGALRSAVHFVKLLATSLLKGLKESLSQVMTPLTNIAKKIKEFFDGLVDLDKRTGVFTSTMRILGNVLGDVVMAALMGIEGAIMGIVQGLELLPASIGWVVAKVKGKNAEADAFARELGGLTKQFAADWAAFGKRAADLAITSGKNIGAAAQGYHLMTPQGAGAAPTEGAKAGATQGPSYNIQMGIQVTEGDARAAGRNYMDGIHDAIRKQVMAGGWH